MNLPHPGRVKIQPEAHVSWPAEGLRISGMENQLTLGKGCRVLLDGKLMGFRLDQYGGSLDLALKVIKIEKVSEIGDEEGEPVTEIIKRLRKPKKT